LIDRRGFDRIDANLQKEVYLTNMNNTTKQILGINKSDNFLRELGKIFLKKKTTEKLSIKQ
jgi:nitrogenase molybdenum-iron protein alpha/beta subunit